MQYSTRVENRAALIREVVEIGRLFVHKLWYNGECKDDGCDRHQDHSCLRGAWLNRLSQRATAAQTRVVFC